MQLTTFIFLVCTFIDIAGIHDSVTVHDILITNSFQKPIVRNK